ncbi:OB-fold nucleic acid binding domain-containing protein [Brevundimonas sp.]|uniref:helix-hairpin-helix domain-containing protein n=1 Tax=Brevundimonas sp. TaxID=1871086 RepID=UPI00356A0BD0
MGFYASAQLVRDAQESPQKVEVRAIDVNHSVWDNTLEPGERGLALRLGLRQIDGFKEGWATRLAEARDAPFTDVEEMARRTGLEAAAMRKLADADAFRSIGLDRREGLWAVRRLPDDEPLPLFQAARAREMGVEAAANLPLMPLKEHIATDYQTTRLSLKGHPMQILRPVFRAEGVLSAAEVMGQKHGRLVRTAGVVLVRQRPGTGNAIFVTMEDETGVVNALLWARLFETFRREVMAARLMEVEGTVEKSVEGVLHIMVRKVVDRSAELSRLSEDYDLQVELSRADAVKYPQGPRSPTGRHPRDVRILPRSRDFH